jgi:hypothetical protein
MPRATPSTRLAQPSARSQDGLPTSLSDQVLSNGTVRPSQGQASGRRTRAETISTPYTTSSTHEPQDIGEATWNVR